jgi:hypothetical protein
VWSNNTYKIVQQNGMPTGGLAGVCNDSESKLDKSIPSNNIGVFVQVWIAENACI